VAREKDISRERAYKSRNTGAIYVYTDEGRANVHVERGTKQIESRRIENEGE
jgi:hypothetical protein